MKQKNLPARKPAVSLKPKIYALVAGILCIATVSKAQISLLQNYQNNTSAPIGIYQGINFREAGFSGLYPIAGTNGTEFWTISDRGPNVDCANANLAACRPTYDKMFPFPGYAPKIHRIKINGDSIQILQTITMKRPNGSDATGLMNPTGFGSTAAEVISTDTVLDCANFTSKTAAKDTWGIDSEGILVDKDGNFWICEEGGPTIWVLNPMGVVIKRYSPYANLAGAQALDRPIDTAFRYRKNNRGFEGIAMTPNGKVYAFIQSPLLYPAAAVGNNTRIHRILEINPMTDGMRMLVYVNDGITGDAGSNQIRMQDWKLGDAAAVNDSTILVLEAALRGTSDYKRMYTVSINQATPVNSGLYGGSTLEGLVDEAGLLANGIKPVTKTLFMDLLANGWPSVLDKAEGLAIINDSTIAVCNDNDFGQSSPLADGIPIPTTNKSHLLLYALKGTNKLPNYVAPPAIVLPVTLVDFSGRLEAGKTKLVWKTTNEINTRAFEIERSSDGANFNKIGEQQALGGNQNIYHATDDRPLSGSNFYRLKIVDKDGKFRHSSTILVKLLAGGKVELVVYPNPARDQLKISLPGFTGSAQIHILNQQGQKIMVRQTDGSSLSIPVKGLAPGIYVVQLTGSNISEQRKFVKQ